MIKNFPVYITLAILFFSCSSAEKITPEEVAATIRRFDNAWQNKNAKAVDSVLADNYIYFTQSGGVFSRSNILQTAASSEYLLESSERKQISVIIKGNTAVVNTTWKGKGSYYGKPFDDIQRCSVTLIKESGEIRILSEHCTVMTGRTTR